MLLKYFSPNDNKEEAKRKYKILANLYHPDKNNGDNGIMTEINIEYDFICKGIKPTEQTSELEKSEEKNTKKSTIEDITLGDVIDFASFLFDKTEKKRKESLNNILQRHKFRL